MPNWPENDWLTPDQPRHLDVYAALCVCEVTAVVALAQELRTKIEAWLRSEHPLLLQ